MNKPLLLDTNVLVFGYVVIDDVLEKRVEDSLLFRLVILAMALFKGI
jgi:hypothetical protein